MSRTPGQHAGTSSSAWRCPALGLVAEAGGHQRGLQAVAAAHLDRLAVEPGAVAADGAEQLAAHRVEHHAQRLRPRASSSATLTAHAGKPVEVVGGAVQRVDHPAPPARRVAARALLRQQAVVRPLARRGWPRSAPRRRGRRRRPCRCARTSARPRGRGLRSARAAARRPRGRRARPGRGRRPPRGSERPDDEDDGHDHADDHGHPDEEAERLLLRAQRVDQAPAGRLTGCRSSCRRRSTSRRRSASRCPAPRRRGAPWP